MGVVVNVLVVVAAPCNAATSTNHCRQLVVDPTPCTRNNRRRVFVRPAVVLSRGELQRELQVCCGGNYSATVVRQSRDDATTVLLLLLTKDDVPRPAATDTCVSAGKRLAMV